MSGSREMSDSVKRLRGIRICENFALVEQAADEIESLRSRLASAQLELTHAANTCADQQRRAENAEAALVEAEKWHEAALEKRIENCVMELDRRASALQSISDERDALRSRLAEAEALRKDAMEAFALIESAPARGFDVYYAVGMARGFIRRHSLLNAELSKGISKDLSKDDAPDSATHRENERD